MWLVNKFKKYLILKNKLLHLGIITVVILLLLSSCNIENNKFHGYIEGEYLYISPTTSGILGKLSVQRGQDVKQGDILFALEDTELLANISTAQATIAEAQSKLNNLLKGKRPEEIQVIIKQKEQANATLKNALQEYERAKDLVKSNTISQAVLDKREADYKAAKANVDAIEAQLSVAKLSAREDEINAAQAEIELARQRLILAQKQLEDSAPKAGEDAYVENTFFREGEFIQVGKPVLSLLPPQNIKIRFFIPQAKLPLVNEGIEITVGCDGCIESFTAKITFIASEAEYTPPVIYSNESRDKLVFMVEAKPDVITEMLRPGLPVDITLGKK